MTLWGLCPSLGHPWQQDWVPGAATQLWVPELVLEGQRGSLSARPRGETDAGLPPVPAGGWPVAWPSPGAGRSFMRSSRSAPSASSGPRTSASSSSGSSRLWWVPG